MDEHELREKVRAFAAAWDRWDAQHQPMMYEDVWETMDEMRLAAGLDRAPGSCVAASPDEG